MSIRAVSVALLSGVALAAIQLPAVAAPDFVAKQATGEQSSSGLIGAKIQNSAGEVVGDINYLVLDANGTVSTVIIGVGGVLGVGEKNVGVPFKSLTRQDKDGKSVFVLEATKEELTAAPAYEWTEKGLLQKAEEKAKEAVEVVKEKTEGMTKSEDPASSTGTSEGTTGTSKPAPASP